MATSNTTSSSRRKVALIIGNNNYSRPESRLRNCYNDARDLSDKLKSINFNTTTKYDQNNVEMVSTMCSFKDTIQDGDLVLFYFAGHGFQVRGNNYLIPKDDMHIETEEDVEEYGVCVETEIDRFSKRNQSYVTIFILDCCRTYWPKKRGIGEQRGLHEMQPPRGTFIQFACNAGQTAIDGLETDHNGLFTKHLLKYIAKPNEDISNIFRAIRGGVYDESKGTQFPLSMDGIMKSGHVYLNETSTINSESHVTTSSPSYTNDKLMEIIKYKTNDEAVNLDRLNLNSKDMKIVTYLLQNNTTLKNFSLSTNRIADKGIQYLCDALQNNQTLALLNITDNQITDEGIQYLCKFLQNNKTLRVLGLENNQIKDKGIEDLCKVLQNNNTLTLLNLNSNQITDKGIQYLYTILKNNKTLNLLGVLNNPIGNESRQLLQKLKEKNKNLEIHF